MKFLKNEKIEKENIIEKRIYIIGDIKSAHLGFKELGNFYSWNRKKEQLEKIDIDSISILKETEYTNDEIKKAVNTYSENYYKNFKKDILGNRISYSGIFLTEESKFKLIDEMKKLTPEIISESKIYCHHMTICLGEDVNNINLKNKDVVLKIIGYSQSRELGVVAVKVETDIIVCGKFPHITVAVNTDVGGKPSKSNDLKDFIEIDPFFIKGKYNQFKENKDFKFNY